MTALRVIHAAILRVTYETQHNLYSPSYASNNMVYLCRPGSGPLIKQLNGQLQFGCGGNNGVVQGWLHQQPPPFQGARSGSYVCYTARGSLEGESTLALCSTLAGYC